MPKPNVSIAIAPINSADFSWWHCSLVGASENIDCNGVGFNSLKFYPLFRWGRTHGRVRLIFQV